MKLLGRDVDMRALLDRVQGQLRARGLLERGDPVERAAEQDPLAVEPLSFNLAALERTAEPVGDTSGRGLLERAVRTLARPLLARAFETQRLFNGHVRDSYAQLSAEVIRLRAEVAELRSGRPGPKRPPPGRAAGKRRSAAPRPRKRR